MQVYTKHMNISTVRNYELTMTATVAITKCHGVYIHGY